MFKKFFIVTFLFFYSLQGYTQGTVDSSFVDIRSFKNENLEKLRKDPEFNYQKEDIRYYSNEDSDWEWKKWRYEEERKNKAKNGEKGESDWEVEKVRSQESPKLFKSFNEGAIYIASAIVIIFLVLSLLGINLTSLFRKNAKVATQEVQDEDLDKLDKNNLDDKINQAINKGDYTQAIRFLYLKTLFLLSQKQYIHLQKEKTNLEYQSELRQNKKALYEDFKHQSKIFAYIKYGGFEISESQFDSLYPQFKNLHSKI